METSRNIETIKYAVSQLDKAIHDFGESMREVIKSPEGSKVQEWDKEYKRYMRILEDDVEIPTSEFIEMIYLANDVINELKWRRRNEAKNHDNAIKGQSQD